jgi:MoxR-like ATPase
MDVNRASEIVGGIVGELRKVIVGQEEVLEQMTVTLLAGGHALLEGVPGTAKTLTARALAAVAGVAFRRIQFTPDLMPSDIVGVNIYNTATGEFHFRSGPVFADILLADEINRAPAKTQSALLEGMQELQVTIDGITHTLDSEFTVFATQNPVEFEGTYPLPEAQLDRFMLKINVGYPSKQEEDELLLRVHRGFDPLHLQPADIQPCVTAEDMARCREEVLRVRAEEAVVSYVGDVIRATRSSPHLVLGCSPRAAVMVLLAAKTFAAMTGRDFLIPDDVKAVALPALRHRVILRPEADIEGLSADDVIRAVLNEVPVPR